MYEWRTNLRNKCYKEMLEKIGQINIGDLKTESAYKKTLSILLNVFEELCISLQQSESTNQELRDAISRLKVVNEKPKFESKLARDRDEKDWSSKNQESGGGKNKSGVLSGVKKREDLEITVIKSYQ